MNRSLHRPFVLLAALALGLLATLMPGGSAVAAGGKPAPVKVTLKQDQTGRVTSDRAACVRFRTVYGFFRSSEGDLFDAGTTSTDDQGRYPTEIARRGGGDGELFTLVVGDKKCRIAQSRSIAAPNRAGGPAKRKITFQASAQSASGRVTSAKDKCVKKVPVVLFAQLSPSTPYQIVNGTMTDNQGRFGFGARAAARGESAKLFVVTLGDDACRVAQSPTRTVTAG